MDCINKRGKPRVIDGKLFALSELQRRMRALGIDKASGYYSKVFSELPEQRIEPSLRVFRAMAQALGLSLDDMWDILQRCRAGAPRVRCG